MRRIPNSCQRQSGRSDGTWGKRRQTMPKAAKRSSCRSTERRSTNSWRADWTPIRSSPASWGSGTTTLTGSGLLTLYSALPTQELDTYLAVNAPVTGIIQERPVYTNIAGGLGLLASRTQQSVRWVGHFKALCSRARRRRAYGDATVLSSPGNRGRRGRIRLPLRHQETTLIKM